MHGQQVDTSRYSGSTVNNNFRDILNPMPPIGLLFYRIHKASPIRDLLPGIVDCTGNMSGNRIKGLMFAGKSLFRIDEKLLRDETWPAAFGRAGYTTFVSGSIF